MRYKDRAIVYEAENVEDYKSALDSMDLVVSSKMHPAVLAVSGCVPAICIAYDQKQTGFFQVLGLDDCVILIREFSAENLFLKIDGVWRSREEIKNMLREKVPLMRKNVVEAIAFALKPSIIIKQAQTKR
jgi:polysaccharide pyruvyl transferase WcaK-like protein